MTFGAMLIGVGIGFTAMIISIFTGTGLLSALLIYSLASCISTIGILIMKVLYCKADMTRNPPSKQSA